MTDEAFYVIDRDRFVATESTRGPWDPRMQHGGPPSALLAGAIGEFGDDAQAFLVTRVTVELMRPIPIGPVRREVRAIRSGRIAQQIGASLWVDDTEVARATGLRLREHELDVPAPRCPGVEPMVSPAASTPYTFAFFRAEIGYHTAVEIRIARGRWGEGPMAAWLRPRIPLVAGEPMTGLERVMIAADAGNGVCPALDPRRFAFVNADLTVYLRRRPVSDWVGLDARSSAGNRGIGLAQTSVHDTESELGSSLQSLVVRPRDSSNGRAPDAIGSAR